VLVTAVTARVSIRRFSLEIKILLLAIHLQAQINANISVLMLSAMKLITNSPAAIHTHTNMHSFIQFAAAKSEA